MKVILTTNLKKLGKVGDSIKVKDGYARNYLLPKKMALRENKKNLEYYENIKEDIKKNEEQKKEEANNLLSKIKKLNISFTKEADENGQLYGSISKREILNYFSENNIKMHSDDLKIEKPIRNIGEHEIEVNPYTDLKELIKITVKKS
tara:strand:+ start:234 stop:677 length:444 start_codon:yes stop_codon:yes gene_type:complete